MPALKMNQIAGRMKVIRAPQVMYVQEATFIPSGMHGISSSAREAVVSSLSKEMAARGIPPGRARHVVKMASMRIHSRWNRGRHLGWGKGLGDDETYGPPLPNDMVAANKLALVQTKGTEYQRQHAAFINQLPSSGASDSDKLKVRNGIENLYNEWTAFAVDLKGGLPPFEWNRTDPVDAILIAVRDDLRDTVNLIDANKAQAVLAKQIKELVKPGSLPGLPNLPKMDLPWYVWVGGALAAAVAAKYAL